MLSHRSATQGIFLTLAVPLVMAGALFWFLAGQSELSAQGVADTPTPRPTATPRPTPAPECQFLVVTGRDNFGKRSDKPMVFRGTVGRTDFKPDGPEMGGVFTASNVYGNAPCSWSAETNRPWLSIGRSGGTIPAGDADEDIQISINDRVREIQQTGAYTGIIKFNAPGARDPSRTLYIRLDVLASCRFNNDVRILTYEMDEGNDTSVLEKQSIVIRNEEYSGDCDWEASSNQPWVNIVPTKGTLTAGSQAWLEVTITDGIEAYGPGNHNANIEFQGPLFQPSVTSIRMNVIPPPCNLQIDQSDTEVQSVGFAGGPFTPSSVRLTIRNQGGEECRWNALPKERWVDINPLSGTIPKGAVGSLEVAINAEANSLLPGVHSSLVTLTAGAQGNDRSVQVKLNVAPHSCEFRIVSANPLRFTVDSIGNINNKQTIELTNPLHRQNCEWESSANPDWLVMTPREGIVEAGDNPRVKVTIDEQKLLRLPRQPVHEGKVEFHVTGLETATVDVSLEVECRENEPCIDLHSTRENILFGENAELALSMNNPLSQDEVTVKLELTIPDGWSLAAGDYDANCDSGRCSSTHSIPPGEKDDIQILASPNAPSSEERKRTFIGRVEWFYAQRQESVVYEIAFPITIAAASEQIIADYRSTNQAAGIPAAPAANVPPHAPAAPGPATASGQTPPSQVPATGFWANNNLLTLVVAAVVIILLLAFCLLILKALRGVNKVVQNQNTILEGQSRPADELRPGQ